MEDETELQQLQAKIARALYAAAARELHGVIDKETPIPVELIERWVRTGLTQEREALGLGRYAAAVESPAETTPQKRLRRPRRTSLCSLC